MNDETTMQFLVKTLEDMTRDMNTLSREASKYRTALQYITKAGKGPGGQICITTQHLQTVAEDVLNDKT